MNVITFALDILMIHKSNRRIARLLGDGKHGSIFQLRPNRIHSEYEPRTRGYRLIPETVCQGGLDLTAEV